jgi:hypothetical protein
LRKEYQMTEKEFYELLDSEHLSYTTWKKSAGSLLREVRDGVKLYRGKNGLIRFAESVWVIIPYYDAYTQTEWALRERHREFPDGTLDVRDRKVFDPKRGKFYPVAASETLKGTDRGRDKIFATALRAVREEVGYLSPCLSRLSMVSVNKPVYAPSKAFNGITSATVAHVCCYDASPMEWLTWNSEYGVPDEDDVLSVIEKVPVLD